ncbi:TNF receptor-associated factor 6-like [Corticium candelabrum]|uniref:TNF receptor-associated factor 6-like n=1 Tax=Corticium candelabrum TaxID=121492 RepID=UPI002E27061E|nr:TNF receptor-associated factor 6-like [Corticium candelabrum]
MAEPGGFDVCFVEPLSDQHTCPICQLALCNPKLTDCGHQFCEGCLRPLSRNNKVICPLCKRQLKLNEIYPNNLAKREILSLKILCDQHRVGCPWRGELRDRETHRTTCVYMEELCVNQCGENVLKKDMETHKQVECPKRVVFCVYCRELMAYVDLLTHLDECDALPVPCIYQCGATVIRSEMTVHTGIRGSCTKSLLPCEFKHVGCHFEGNRGTLVMHLNDATVSHLNMIASSFQSRLQTVEQKLIETEKKLIESERERAELKQRLAVIERDYFY